MKEGFLISGLDKRSLNIASLCFPPVCAHVPISYLIAPLWNTVSLSDFLFDSCLMIFVSFYLFRGFWYFVPIRHLDTAV